MKYKGDFSQTHKAVLKALLREASKVMTSQQLQELEVRSLFHVGILMTRWKACSATRRRKAEDEQCMRRLCTRQRQTFGPS